MNRFETLDFLDLGGFVNVNLMMDEDRWGIRRGAANRDKEGEEVRKKMHIFILKDMLAILVSLQVYQVIRGCLSHGRPPTDDVFKCPSDSIIEV